MQQAEVAASTEGFAHQSSTVIGEGACNRYGAALARFRGAIAPIASRHLLETLAAVIAKYARNAKLRARGVHLTRA